MFDLSVRDATSQVGRFTYVNAAIERDLVATKDWQISCEPDLHILCHLKRCGGIL